MLVHYLAVPYAPVNTAVWFYKLPIWSLLKIDINVNSVNLVFENPTIIALLNNYASVEFNNPGGVFMPYCDYGLILGTFCWLILGLVSGGLMRGFIYRTPFGLVLYPVWYFGVLEVLRVFYWGDSRFFPVIVASFFVMRAFRRTIPQNPRQPVPAQVFGY
jgi:hypothetical protein